jgi:hypothetical protein
MPAFKSRAHLKPDMHKAGRILKAPRARAVQQVALKIQVLQRAI